MCKNVGNLDSGIRITIGTAILVIGAYYQNWWGLLGLIPWFTGVFHWCGLYKVFGWNTACCCSCETEIKPKAKKRKR